MSVNMNTLLKPGFLSSVLYKGRKAVWPYWFMDDDIDGYRACLKIAKDQGIDEWIIEDYDLVNYHSKASDNRTPYVRLNSAYTQSTLYSDIVSMLKFEDIHEDSKLDTLKKGLLRVQGLDDFLVDSPINSFYRQYVEFIKPWISMERSLAVLASIKFGSSGVQMRDGSRLALSSLMDLMGTVVNSLTKINDPYSMGGFWTIWTLTMSEGRVHNRLRDYDYYRDSRGVYACMPMRDDQPNELPIYTEADDSWIPRLGRWSADDWSVSNGLMLLHRLRQLNVDVRFQLGGDQLTIANANIIKRANTSYLC